eukprot:758532-Hanusia_phi.AAC.1
MIPGQLGGGPGLPDPGGARPVQPYGHGVERYGTTVLRSDGGHPAAARRPPALRRLRLRAWPQ